MEQLAPRYASRRNASLAASDVRSASQTSDAKALEELARQQNVPSLLLMDAARFYKKGHTARQEVAAAVKSQQTDIVEMRRQIDTLVKDGRMHQRRLDNVEDCITFATDDLGSLCENIDTLRQGTLRTNDVATRNNQDIGKLAERFDKLERDLAGSVCEDIDTLRQYTLGINDVTTSNKQDIGELTERFDKLERDVAALRESEKHNADFRSQMQAFVLGISRPHSGILEHSGGPRSHGPVLDSVKGTGNHMVGRSLHVPDKPTAPQDYTNHHAVPPVASRTELSPDIEALPCESQPEAGPSQRSGKASHSPIALENVIYTRRAPVAVLETPIPMPDPTDSGDETASEASDMELEPEVSKTAHSKTLEGSSKRSSEILLGLLNQADKRHANRTPKSDYKAIWQVIHGIKDNNLSKRLQLFILSRCGPKLVSKSRLSSQRRAEKNQYIHCGKLSWSVFVRVVREYVKPGLRQ